MWYYPSYLHSFTCFPRKRDSLDQDSFLYFPPPYAETNSWLLELCPLPMLICHLPFICLPLEMIREKIIRNIRYICGYIPGVAKRELGPLEVPSRIFCTFCLYSVFSMQNLPGVSMLDTAVHLLG